MSGFKLNLKKSSIDVFVVADHETRFFKCSTSAREVTGGAALFVHAILPVLLPKHNLCVRRCETFFDSYCGVVSKLLEANVNIGDTVCIKRMTTLLQ